MTAFTLTDLDRLIVERTSSSAAKSYTRSLLDKGPAGCAKKFGEESVEFVIATTQGDQASVTAEAADVLYHLLVALHASAVPLQDVLSELERRTTASGHEEKASRARTD
ncbi:MAG: phosphoribosyl-ATP diphosphatase [Beijerinckiaceae bacterium]|nr:phosphoribosyl-ATP diphosphatase [Beijerinckiaceae bacterium]